jgi:CRISPR-associated protein Csx16
MGDNLIRAIGPKPARTRLVSFLGTNRYTSTRHRFPDESVGAETEYVCRALGGFVRADEIAVIATAEAEAAHREKLAAELRNENLPAPDFRRVPKGESQAELWSQFGVAKELVRAPADTAVMLDITHAFRSQPFFTAAVTAFVRAVDPEPASIRVFYAAFEARQEGVTPIWELTPFIELVDWAQGMMLFLRTGRSRDIARPTIRLGRELGRRSAQTGEGPRLNLARLGKALQDFGANLETVSTGDLLLGSSGSAAQLGAVLEEAKESAAAVPPLADVLDSIRRDVGDPLLGASDHLASETGHQALAGLARLYLAMGRWAEAAAVVREGWITRHARPAAAFGERNQARPSIDEAAREAAEERLNESEGDAVRRIAQVRNDLEHAGFNKQPQAAEVLQSRLQRLVAEFAVLRPAEQPRVAARPPIFVNLSNHPSGEWDAAQRAAALALAPEIRDWRFPEVPPEAGRDEIAALADRLAEQIASQLPSASHAMVQGEFTLAHALVRRLQQRGISCLAATTRREVLEDCGAVKTTRFEFVRFREYG